ncbi:MAG: hypothetical protein AAGE92_00075 [Cyanobacteria bacterium P01_G01_bin.4]
MSDDANRQALIELAERELERRETESANESMVGRAARGIGDRALAVGETGLMLGTSALAQIPVGLRGIVEAAIPGGMTGTEAIESSSERLTFRPRRERSQDYAQALASIIEPVDQVTQDSAFLVGQGSPAASAALLSAPAAIGAGLGLQSLRRGAASSVRAADAPEPNVFGSTQELFDEGGRLFREAEAQGVRVNTDATKDLGVKALDAAKGIDPDLHPDSTAVLRRIVDAAESGELSLEQLNTLRQIANDGVGGKPRDARIAKKLVGVIDNFVDGLESKGVTSGDIGAANEALKRARNLWGRARRSEVIDEAFRRAENKAGDATGAGFEHKLRIEFQQIANNKKRLRQFTPDEQRLIEGVARGDAPTRALRMIGKLAPTGVVSGGIGIGGSAALLAPTLGPVLGPAALPLAGILGRQAATSRTINAARGVSESIRRDGG